MATIGSVSYTSPVNFQIPQQPPQDLPQPVQNAFKQVYLSLQQVIFAFQNNCGIGPQNFADWPQLAGVISSIQPQNLGRFICIASENIQYGAMISITSAAGVIRVQNANATNNTKPCVGYCNTVGGVLINTPGEFIIGPGIAPIGGITIGQKYYLSTTNGLITNVAPVAAGNIEQFLGFGVDVSAVYINPHYWIQH